MSDLAGLAKTINDELTGLITFIDRSTVQLNRLIKLEDAFIDQLMEVKQLAWTVRDRGGEHRRWCRTRCRVKRSRRSRGSTTTSTSPGCSRHGSTLLQMAAGLPLPPAFNDAVELAKREFFGREYTELRTNTLKQLIAGQKPSITVEQWSGMTVPKLATSLAVAEVALDVAKEHAAHQHAVAMRSLMLQLGLLVVGARLWLPA